MDTGWPQRPPEQSLTRWYPEMAVLGYFTRFPMWLSRWVDCPKAQPLTCQEQMSDDPTGTGAKSDCDMNTRKILSRIGRTTVTEGVYTVPPTDIR